MAITVAQSYLFGYLNPGSPKEYCAFCTCSSLFGICDVLIKLQRPCLITPRSPSTCSCVQLGTFLKGLLGSSRYFSSYLLCAQRSPCKGDAKGHHQSLTYSEKVQNNEDLVFYFCCVCFSCCGLC